MQQTVLAEPELSAYAERFVWVSLDTDRAANEAPVGRFPPLAWPTFYVVEPQAQTISARFVGGASLEQFKALLDSGAKASVTTARQASPESLVGMAHEAEAKRDYQEAAKIYARALALAPKSWPRRSDILVSRIRALVRTQDYAAALAFAKAEGTATDHTASAADFAYYAMTSVKAIEGDPEVLAPIASHVLAAVDAEAGMSVDDRSDALRVLREIALVRGQAGAALELAKRQRALLDAVVAEASPEVVMTFNWPAAEVYAFLGEPLALVPRLEKNMADLPDEYDPPARLAWVLLQGQDAKRALPYAEAALGKVYGPRKARVYDLLADIHVALGDRDAERSARSGTVEVLSGLPAGQRNPAYLKQAQARLIALGEAGSAGE